MSQYFDDSQIVYEDNHMLVINKKAGQLVQGDKTGDLSLLELIKDFIKKEMKNQAMFFLVWFTGLTGQLRAWLSMQKLPKRFPIDSDGQKSRG
jgi:hypothetical protein